MPQRSCPFSFNHFKTPNRRSAQARWGGEDLGRGGNGIDSAASEVLRCLGDPDAKVRVAALKVLQQMGSLDAAMVDSIGALLQDKDRNVRLTAANCLGDFGAAAATFAPRLIQAVQDSDRLGRLVARKALCKVAKALFKIGADNAVILEALHHATSQSEDPILDRFVKEVFSESDFARLDRTEPAP